MEHNTDDPFTFRIGTPISWNRKAPPLAQTWLDPLVMDGSPAPARNIITTDGKRIDLGDMKVHVHLGHEYDPVAYEKRYERGLHPDRYAYGFHHAREFSTNVTYSRSRPNSFLSKFVRRGLRKVLGFDFLHAIDNRKAIFAADVIWTITENDYLAAAALLLVSRQKHPKIVGNSVWLFNKIGSTGRMKRAFYRLLLKRVAIGTVHSAACLPIARAIFPETEFKLMHFGISVDAFPMVTPTVRRAPGPIRVFAPGNDETRDWACMFRALGNDSRFEVIVVCDRMPDRAIAPYKNFTFRRSPRIAEFNELYSWSDFVLVPLIPNPYSGITVALEAVAMGRCVVSAETGGVPTYLSRDEAIYYTPSDADLLRTAMLECDEEERVKRVQAAQRTFRKRDYSTTGLISRYAAASQGLQDLP